MRSWSNSSAAPTPPGNSSRPRSLSCVKVEESAKWGELKKLLAYTGEIATIQSTGEIVEGVTAYETPATFTVDI